MTQSIFPTSDTAVIPQQARPAGPPDAADQPVLDAGTDGGSQRKKIIALVATGAVIVVASGAYLMLHSGSSSPSASPVPPPHSHAAAQPAGGFNAPAFPNLPKAFQGAIGRDPFQPLVNPPAASTSPAGGTSTVTSAGPAPSSTAPTSTTPVVVVPTSPSGSTGTSAAAPDWIEMDSQNGSTSATFFVHYADGLIRVFQNVPAPAQGQTTPFGGVFQLAALQTGFAVVHTGSAAPFDLMQGYANRHMLG